MRFKSGIIFAAVILAILVLIPVSGHASSQETKQGVSDYFNLIAFSSNNDFLNVEEDDDIFLGEDEESLFKKDKKSVVRGFFYSLAIPGVGEYYAESKYKPYIFFSADVLLWSGYFLYNKKGRD
ncbi:MAG: hypothetical protein GY855_01230, partial [candidate division Zixibacteria bacterium]|nr:hypothetical protein [candidate division Zixibacteria bacterium]